MGRHTTKHDEAILQAAVIAVRHGRICLITSSGGKRWLLPKGHQEDGMELRETARQEAWEEAGVLGRIARSPVGTYEYQKLRRRYRVVIFWMRVTHVQRKWPECKRRRRRWLTPEQALELISQAQLRKTIDKAVHRRRAA